VLPPPVQKFSFYRIGRACLNMFSNFGWGAHIGFGEGAEFGTGRGRQHGDADVPGKEAVPALDGVPVFPRRFCGTGTVSTAAVTRLLSGLAVLRPGLVGIEMWLVIVFE
jgi:hypothetical protein